MKSGKRRRADLRARRRARQETPEPPPHPPARPAGTAPVNSGLLAPFNSYGLPAFIARGYYLDSPFRCAGCGREEVWTVAQQKWWYEVAKGNVESTAKRCRPRRRDQARRAEARRVQLEGVAGKGGTNTDPDLPSLTRLRGN